MKSAVQWFKNFIQQHWVLLGVVLSSLLILTLWFVPPVYLLKTDSIKVTVPVTKEKQEEKSFGPGTENWVGIGKLPKHVYRAMIAAEDTRFYLHGGLDYEEIRHSIDYNFKKKRYARGASTLTQQVIKMAFLSRRKSIVRKAREALGALLVEKILSKNEIVEWYINLAELGPGIFGVKQAAQYYFHKRPEQLTLVESVHLALILPSPLKWSSGLVDRKLTDFGKRRFSHILRTMRQMGFIGEEQFAAARAEGNFGRPIGALRVDADKEISDDQDDPLFGEEQSKVLSEEDDEWIDKVFEQEAVPSQAPSQSPSSSTPSSGVMPEEESATPTPLQ